MKKNVIPRAARSLRLTFKRSTSHSKEGDVVIVHKNDNGWVGLFPNGKYYYCFVGMIRDPEICSLEIIA